MRCAPEEAHKMDKSKRWNSSKCHKKNNLSYPNNYFDISSCGGEINGNFISSKCSCLSFTNASSLSTPHKDRPTFEKTFLPV